MVLTEYPIVSCIISYDSTRTIVITKCNDYQFFVRMFDLENDNRLCFTETIGSGDADTDFIRAKDIVQNIKGNKYAFTYFNNGQYKLRVFDKKERNPRIVEKDDYDLNRLIGVDTSCMAINGFNDPFTTCCFLTDDKLLGVSVYHAPTHCHYHMIINSKKRDVVGEVQKYKIPNSNPKNFPYG